jgi:hypothetical protein
MRKNGIPAFAGMTPAFAGMMFSLVCSSLLAACNLLPYFAASMGDEDHHLARYIALGRT